MWLHMQSVRSQRAIGVNEVIYVDLCGHLELGGPSAMGEVVS
jgi:hypothetical protein